MDAENIEKSGVSKDRCRAEQVLRGVTYGSFFLGISSFLLSGFLEKNYAPEIPRVLAEYNEIERQRNSEMEVTLRDFESESGKRLEYTLVANRLKVESERIINDKPIESIRKSYEDKREKKKNIENSLNMAGIILFLLGTFSGSMIISFGVNSNDPEPVDRPY